LLGGIGMVKRQHYVPRFYLRHFATDDHKINYYDKILRKPLSNMHVDNVAQESYYYDFSDEFMQRLKEMRGNEFNEDFIDKQFLEKYFSKLESDLALTFKKVNEKVLSTGNLCSLQITEIINDEALQSIRTPSYRILGEKFFEFMRNVLPEPYNLIFGEDNNIGDNERLLLHLGSGVLERLSTHFCRNFNWYLAVIENPQEAKFPHIRKTFVTDEFLISDNPIINIKHVAKKNPEKISLEFGLPLTPKHLVILRDSNFPFPNPNNSIFEIDRNLIRFYNEYQCRFSHRKVFYSLKSNEKKLDSFYKKFPDMFTHNAASFCVCEF
jgi:hypothetical protein